MQFSLVVFSVADDVKPRKDGDAADVKPTLELIETGEGVKENNARNTSTKLRELAKTETAQKPTGTV